MKKQIMGLEVGYEIVWAVREVRSSGYRNEEIMAYPFLEITGLSSIQRAVPESLLCAKLCARPGRFRMNRALLWPSWCCSFVSFGDKQSWFL